nr:MAG TPA: hypothetical protein [Caudoviricetes sp.]DAM14824.1 MAG TPA: hypothetical protein [Caudoviricetes sp.]DAQ09510.1 MAG TPA: hypothetical protein [Caudoviricetes sp.]
MINQHILYLLTKSFYVCIYFLYIVSMSFILSSIMMS